MYNKSIVKSERSKLKLFASVVFFALVAILILLVVLDALKNARVSILVAPYESSTIKINGKSYKSGYYRFYPKNDVKVTISAPGFETKELTINLEAKKTIALHEYLKNEDDGLHYYMKNDDDFNILRQVAKEDDEEVIALAERKMKNEYISDYLPIVVDVDFNKYPLPEKYNSFNTTTIQFDQDKITKGQCKTKLCLYITGYQNEDIVKDTLKDYGFDYADFEIYYAGDNK